MDGFLQSADPSQPLCGGGLHAWNVKGSRDRKVRQVKASGPVKMGLPVFQLLAAVQKTLVHVVMGSVRGGGQLPPA